MRSSSAACSGVEVQPAIRLLLGKVTKCPYFPSVSTPAQPRRALVKFMLGHRARFRARVPSTNYMCECDGRGRSEHWALTIMDPNPSVPEYSTKVQECHHLPARLSELAQDVRGGPSYADTRQRPSWDVCHWVSSRSYHALAVLGKAKASRSRGPLPNVAYDGE
jgi:hypothetical protein